MSLADEVNEHLRQLRRCDTQATAVAWMAKAYQLFERCLPELGEKSPQVIERLVKVERLVFVPERPAIEVVQPGAFDERAAAARRQALQERSHARTVVYPEVYLPPGLKPLPKPWTREDTRRLERAARARPAPIQRKGK